MNFTNNFYIEWTIIEGLKATGRVSFTTKRSDADEYYPYNHTSQSNYGRDVYYKRGAYTLNTGKSNTVSGDIYLNFSRTWGKHYSVMLGGIFQRMSIWKSLMRLKDINRIVWMNIFLG